MGPLTWQEWAFVALVGIVLVLLACARRSKGD